MNFNRQSIFYNLLNIKIINKIVRYCRLLHKVILYILVQSNLKNKIIKIKN